MDNQQRGRLRYNNYAKSPYQTVRNHHNGSQRGYKLRGRARARPYPRKPEEDTSNIHPTTERELDAGDVIKWVEREGGKTKRLEQDNRQLFEELNAKKREVGMLTSDNRRLRSLSDEMKEKWEKLQTEYDNVAEKQKEDHARLTEELQKKDIQISSLTETVENLKTTKDMLEQEKRDAGRQLELQVQKLQEELRTQKGVNEKMKAEMIKHKQEVGKVLADNQRYSEIIDAQANAIREEFEKEKIMVATRRRKLEKTDAALQEYLQKIGIMPDKDSLSVGAGSIIAGEHAMISVDDDTATAENLPDARDPETLWERFFVGDENCNRGSETDNHIRDGRGRFGLEKNPNNNTDDDLTHTTSSSTLSNVESTNVLPNSSRHIYQNYTGGLPNTLVSRSHQPQLLNMEVNQCQTSPGREVDKIVQTTGEPELASRLSHLKREVQQQD